MKVRSFGLATAALLFATTAFADVTLEGRQATVGTPYKAVFVVPHGCAGSATIKLRVQVPAGVIAVKPQPKPGWQIKTVKGKYDKAYTFDGAKLEGVREVDWSGGKLPDDYLRRVRFQRLPDRQLKPDDPLLPGRPGVRARRRTLDRNPRRRLPAGLTSPAAKHVSALTGAGRSAGRWSLTFRKSVGARP